MKKIITIIFAICFLNSCTSMNIDSNNLKEQFLKFKNSKTHDEFIEK